MRELKFRAWDKINSRWIDLYTIRFSKDGAIIAVTDIKGEMYGLHQIDLVHFTSLKDKAGTEIYEGDILQFGAYPGEKEDSNSEVNFVGGSFRVEHKGFRKEMAENKHGAWVYLDVEADTGKVIGNIYENPELLEIAKEEI